jgi:hypothetical protein
MSIGWGETAAAPTDRRNSRGHGRGHHYLAPVLVGATLLTLLAPCRYGWAHVCQHSAKAAIELRCMISSGVTGRPVHALIGNSAGPVGADESHRQRRQ